MTGGKGGGGAHLESGCLCRGGTGDGFAQFCLQLFHLRGRLRDGRGVGNGLGMEWGIMIRDGRCDVRCDVRYDVRCGVDVM